MALPTGRGRTWCLIAAAGLAIALIAAGTRYVWLRHERRQTEQTVARLTRTTSDALDLLREVQSTRDGADARNATVQAERDRVRQQAAILHADLSRTRADTAAAAVDAYLSGVGANNLRACLTGVSQALNQLAVRDGDAIQSLRAVDTPCRAAGIT